MCTYYKIFKSKQQSTVITGKLQKIPYWNFSSTLVTATLGWLKDLENLDKEQISAEGNDEAVVDDETFKSKASGFYHHKL